MFVTFVVFSFIFGILKNKCAAGLSIIQSGAPRNETEVKECAFLNISGWKQSISSAIEDGQQCCNYNITIQTNFSDFQTNFLHEASGTCCTDTPRNNLTIDVNVNENCIIVINNGFNKIAYQGGRHKSRIISNQTSIFATSCQCDQFRINGSELIGIIFSPYDKHPEECSELDDAEKSCLLPTHIKHVNWWNYSKEEIIRQLELVSTEFGEISTYGIGTVAKTLNPPDFNHDWRDGLPISLVPINVAEVNKNAGYHKLKIIVGAFSHESYASEHFQAEVENAVAAAKDAEIVFPNSVSGISIHFNVVTMQNEKHISLVEKSMTFAKRYTHDGRVGVRLEECDRAFKDVYNRSEESARLYCKPTDRNCTDDRPLLLEPTLEPLIKTAHFVICFIRPQHQIFAKNLNLRMVEIVAKLGHRLEEIKKALLKVNPKVELIVETGWPSQGTSPNGFPNSLKNMIEYWTQMINWATTQRLKIFMFEAFDEPWKKDLTLQGRNESNGLCGSEDHYGWWRRKDNSDPAVYQRKYDSSLTRHNNVSNSLIDPMIFPEECELDEQAETPRGKILVLAISITGIVFGLMVFGLGYMAFRLKVVKTNSHLQLSQKYLEIFRDGYDAKTKSVNNSLDNDDYQIIALQFPYDKRKYELAQGSFKIDFSKSIGKGQSGTVYLGQVNGYSDPVAFKSSDSSSSVLDIKNFLSEIKIMSYIGQHPHVICLIGAYTDKLERGIVNLALEYCPLGSLDKFLQGKGQYKSQDVPNIEHENLNYVTTACLESQSSSSSSSSGNEDEECEDTCKPIMYDLITMVKWSYQIANGMGHLASKKVVHADLACRNILLTKELSIKLTDFGLSRKLYSEINPNLVYDSDLPLPWRWLSPESMRKLVFSTESDVFSFGVTLWEIFSLGDVPFAGLAFCNQFVNDVEEGMRLEDAKYATDEMLDLMDKCWASNPSDRPNFTSLKEELGRLLQLYSI